MASKLEEQIERLQARLGHLKKQQQLAEARRRFLTSRQARRDETRRKILIGAVVLARINQGRLTADELRVWLEQALTRPIDRSLFGLK